jgi:thiol-disulfide isomerase/thioredoxin
MTTLTFGGVGEIGGDETFGGKKMNEINKELGKLYEEMRSSCCGKCREERKEFAKDEKKYHNTYSDVYLGFPVDISPSIDVLLVLEGHGGGHAWLPEKEQNFENSVKQMEKWYRDVPKFETYHQKCVHSLLKKLDENNIRWFLTDLIKCYIFKKDKENKDRAAGNCIKYLERQIKMLNPRVIVMFGNFVQQQMWLHKIYGEKDRNRFLNSPFPSALNADKWVTSGDVDGLVSEITRNVRTNKVT